MLKLMWYVAFFFSTLLKLKFKAFYKYATCARFRSDISNIINLLSQGMPKVREDYRDLYKLHLSHDILYPNWVKKLRGKNLKKTKIYAIKDGNKYIVVNGNHRLRAMMEVWEPNVAIWFNEVYFPNKKVDNSYIA